MHTNTTILRSDLDSDNFYTPAFILEKVSEVLGGVTLDPCAEPLRRTPAQQHFTFEDDGLSRKWHGTIFMNPPYSQPNLKLWTQKLIAEFESRRVSAAIALLPANTSSSWAVRLLQIYPAAFFKQRIRFIGADYKPAENSGRGSHMLVYFGSEWDKFKHAFYDICTFPNSCYFDHLAAENRYLKLQLEKKERASYLKTLTEHDIQEKRLHPDCRRVREPHQGSGCIHQRSRQRKSGKEYFEYWFKYTVWRNGKSVQRSIYIPKGALDFVQEMNEQKESVDAIVKQIEKAARKNQ